MWKILVVDDEQAQRETLCRGLHLLGHQCVSAANGRQGLERLREQTDAPFDLLLTDLTMPGDSGLLLIQDARCSWPNLRVLVISGLHCTREISAVRALGIPILKKPFTPDQLDAAIRQLCKSPGDPHDKYTL